MNKQTRLGIIGGLGPLASSFFYELITKHTLASCDQDHLDLVLFSHATMIDRTEALKTAAGRRVLIDTLVQDARLLEQAGAKYIAVPCNTTHVVWDEVVQESGALWIHMIRETAEAIRLKYPDVRRVGILATDGTIENALYQKELIQVGLEPMIPPQDMQQKVMQVIYEQVKAGKAIDYDMFAQLTEEFHRSGAEVIILGCTELSVIHAQRPLPSYCVDAMKILVRRSLEFSGATYVEEA